MAGKNLVDQGKLRTIISDVNKYRVAVNTFKLQFDAIPGDFNSAEEYWADDTINGDGNKLIQLRVGLGVTANESPANRSYEYTRFWEHLSLSNLLPGNYQGAFSSATGLINANVLPNGPFNNQVFFIFGEANFNTGPYDGGNALSLGSYRANNPIQTTHPSNASLTPEQAGSIDIKGDDGNAVKGKIQSDTSGANYWGTTSSNCRNSGGTYLYENKEVNCKIKFLFH